VFQICFRRGCYSTAFVRKSAWMHLGENLPGHIWEKIELRDPTIIDRYAFVCSRFGICSNVTCNLLDGLYLFVKYYQGSFIYICKTQYSLLHCIFAQIEICFCKWLCVRKSIFPLQSRWSLFASLFFFYKADRVCCKMLDLFV